MQVKDWEMHKSVYRSLNLILRILSVKLGFRYISYVILLVGLPFDCTVNDKHMLVPSVST